MNFDGRKILFLSPNFFGYEKAIQKRLEELDGKVDFYNERPSDSVLSKGIIRVKSSLYQKKIDQYYRKILNEISSQRYNFLLLIKGESVPFFFLEKFREANPKAVMIYYSYDAVSEYPKSEKLYPYFDQNFTFEPSDSTKYNLHFRPLFFLDEYLNSKINNSSKYQVSFIGSAHTDRYLVGEKVRQEADKLSLKTYFYYYAPGKTAFKLKKIFDKNLQKFDSKKLSFKKLSHSEIKKIYEDSFAVLDVNKPFQAGLTMRTFEALASGKKLITTNSDVKNYPFYSEDNICILNREHISLKPEFFEKPFRHLEQAVFEKMSLDSWIECLFVKNQDEYWSFK